MSTISTLPSNFKVLEPSDLDWIAQAGTLQDLPIGSTLIQEGQPADALYFILQGSVSISISQHQSALDQEIVRCGTGEIVGEMSFIDDRLPPATIKTVELTQLLSVSKRQLQLKMERDTDFSARLYQEFAILLSSRLRSLSKLLAQSKIVPGQALRKVLFLFAVLNDNDIDWLVTRGSKQEVPAGTLLIRQDHPVEALYFLLKGNLTVLFSMMVDGHMTERELARRASGEIVGESFATHFYRAISLVLIDRLREGLIQRGLGQKAYTQDQQLAEGVECDDEIPLDVLEPTLLAGTRFKWMMNRLQRN